MGTKGTLGPHHGQEGAWSVSLCLLGQQILACVTFFAHAFVGGPAACRICPPNCTVKEPPGQAASGQQQGHPGGPLEEPRTALPHMCDLWCLGTTRGREQSFLGCWVDLLAGRRIGRIGALRSDLRAAQGQGGGGRAGLTSANLSAEQRGLSPRLPWEGVPARLLPPLQRALACFFFFFLLPDFSPFFSLFLVPDL